MLNQFFQEFLKADGTKHADTTIKNYKCTLLKIEAHFQKDLYTLCKSKESQTELYNYVLNLPIIKDKRKKDIMDILISFTKHYKEELPQDYLVNTFNTVTVSHEKILEKKQLPEKNELKKVLEKAEITNVEHNLILNLLLCYNTVWRTDISSIRLKNFDEKIHNFILDGKLVINSTNKTHLKNKQIIELNKNDCELLLKLDQDDLFTSNASDRGIAYSKLIPIITQKYLGTRFKHTDFRIMNSMNNYRVIEANTNNMNLKEQILALNTLAENSGHSLLTMLTTYINI